MSRAAAALQYFESLRKELSCSICLCVMTVPVARLPCCHYFCMECIQQSVQHRPQCPVCKSKVGRRDVYGDSTMDRVVAAFAKMEARKDELIGEDADDEAPAGLEVGDADAAVGTSSREEGEEVTDVDGAATPESAVAPPATGGICWLAGVDNEEYRSPSVSLANSMQRRLAQAREARRLSLHSVQGAAAQGSEAEEQAPAAPAAGAEEAGNGVPGGKENAVTQHRQKQQRGKPARASAGAAAGSKRGSKEAAAQRGEHAGEARPGGDTRPERQDAVPPAAAPAPAAVAAAAAAEPAGLASPGESADLQGVLAEVHALAAAAAGPADSMHSGGGGSTTAAPAGQMTPQQPAQAAAPRTDKAAVAVVQAPAEAAQLADAGQGRGKGKGRRSTGSKRAAAGASDAAAVAGAVDAKVEQQAGGPAEKKDVGSKRSRTAASTAAATRRRPALAELDAGTPAAAMLGAAAAAAGPGCTRGAGDGGGASAGGRRRIPARLLPWNCARCTFENQGAAHKCDMCGLKKKVLPAAELAAVAGAMPAAATAAAAEQLQDVASPAATTAGGSAAANAEQAQQGQQGHQQEEQQQPKWRQAATAGGGRQQKQQRKMSIGRPAADAAAATAGGSSGKRRKLSAPAVPAAAVPEPAGQSGPSPAATTRRRAGTPAAAWRSASGPGSSGPWVLLGSTLSPAGKQQLAQLATAAGARVAKDWCKEVTHVVCGTTVDGLGRRTFKFMMGLLCAKWVVQEEWLGACLDQQGPADERSFLVQKDHAGMEGGATAALSCAEMGLPPLLQGFEVYMAGDFSSRDDVCQLLRAAGAKLLSRPPAGQAARAAAGPCTSFLLCEADASGGSGSPKEPSKEQAKRQSPATAAAAAGGDASGDAGKQAALAAPPAVAAAKWYQKAACGGVPVVSHRWLLDSISAYTLQPLAGYRFC